MIRRSCRHSSNARQSVPALLILLYLVVPGIRLSAQPVQLISPLPGSTSVSQETTILLRSESTFVGSLAGSTSVFIVRGSQSGVHSGRTTIVDDGHALLFSPSSPFAPAETVYVDISDEVRTGDGTAVGPFGFQFTVAQLSGTEKTHYLESTGFIGESAVMSGRVQSNVASLAKTASEENGLPLPSEFPRPVVTTSQNPTDGFTFLTTFHLHESGNFIEYIPTDEQYLMIVDNSGTPQFFRALGALSTDFKVQPNGNLTYYDGVAKEYFELDKSYSVVDSFQCGNGYATDLHELLLLQNGHALLLGTDVNIVDMSAVVPGGSKAAKVIGSVIQELDQDKNVVFQWRSIDYTKVTDATHEDLTAATIDYIHSNALDVDSDGNILLSSRHIDEITKINRQTGAVIWRWGGKNNQFTFVNDTIGFSHQHCIRRSPSGTPMLFDDGNFHVPQFSRAVEYAVDEQAKTATLVWQFRHQPDAVSVAMGSVERLANGNTFIGWGSALTTAVTEVRPDGSVAFEMALPDSVVSYRAFRFPWSSAAGTTAVQSGDDVPTSYALSQNYPNPFNPSTVIQYTIPRSTPVSLRVYDMLGREIATLVDRNQVPGSYSVRFDASMLSSGVYFYRLTTNEFQSAKTMTILK